MSKYNARKTVIDGYTFDSMKEGRRYVDLKLMQSAKKIRGLEIHPKYLLIDGFSIGKKRFKPVYYIRDFAYYENGRFIVEDVKGVETDVFKLKAKLFRKKYGFEIKIVR